MRIKLDLDETTTERLIEVAERERRPIAWQAEVILLRGLGLWPVEVEVKPRAEAGIGDVVSEK